ncbi:hypothetical protein D560_0460 [Bordetella holmesii ATCC 51541]|nr:hypothetical protein D560_0460 [Bordetella holmesii ATCC 51541]
MRRLTLRFVIAALLLLTASRLGLACWQWGEWRRQVASGPLCSVAGASTW